MNADRDAGWWRRDGVRRLALTMCSAAMLSQPRFVSCAQEPAPARSTSGRYLPLLDPAGNWHRSLSFTNLGASAAPVTATAYLANGAALPWNGVLPGGTGATDRILDSMTLSPVPATMLNLGANRTTGTVLTMVSADHRQYDLIEAIDSPALRLAFPALTNAPATSRRVTLFNAGPTAASIEVTAITGDGHLVGATILPPLPPGASRTFTAAEIFPPGSSEAISTLATASREPLLGWQTLASTHADMAVLPGLATTSKSWSFPVTPRLAGERLWTSVGIFNPGTTIASVAIGTWDENDRFLGMLEVRSLPPQSIAQVSTAQPPFPAAARRIHLSSDQPILSYGVVGLHNGKGIAAIPAVPGEDQVTAGFELHGLPDTGALAISRLVRTEGNALVSLVRQTSAVIERPGSLTRATLPLATAAFPPTPAQPSGQKTPSLAPTTPVRAAAPAKIFIVNSRGDAADAVPGDGSASTGGTILRNGQPEPEVTLRSALTEADQTVDLDEIRFDVPGAAVTLFPQGSVRGILGALRPVIIDGTTQPMDGIIIVDGSQAGTHDPAGREMVGIELVGVGSTVRGLFITRFAFDGVRIRQSGGPNGSNVIEGNVIQANDRHGVYISDSPNNLVGGTTTQAMNVISLNKGNGVRIQGAQSAGNKVQGNRIGTDRTGTQDRSNLDDQVAIDQAPDTIVGEPNVAPAPPAPAGASNVIVGKRLGVNINGLLTTTTSTKVNANFIGLDTVEATLTGGILASGSLLTAGGNVITKVSGVEIQGFFQVNGMIDIRHNQLRADALEGINLRFDEGREMTIQLEENVILNARRGVVAEESIRGNFNWNALRNDVQADDDALFINFHARGEKVFGGRWTATAGAAFLYNVDIDDALAARLRVEAEATGGSGGVVGSVRAATLFSYVAVGGSRRGGSGSGDKITVGVGFSGQMEARYRDLDASFSAQAGLWLENQTSFRSLLTVFVERTTARENIIGLNFLNLDFGRTAENCTIINNRDAGIRLAQGTNGRILNSTIAGNGIGVEILDTAFAVVQGNVLTANGLAVAADGTGAGSHLSGNSFFANTTLGIDLGKNGVTANDNGDADTGPNGLQNFPVLTSVTSVPAGTTINGTLNSTPLGTFTVEFFSNSTPHPSGFGEGEVPLGSAQVSTDSNGNASFSAALAAVVPGGRFVSATATDAAGNTSEFSANVQVNGSANISPTALATVLPGSVVGQLVSLNGSASFDVDGGPSPLTHSWTQLSGSFVTLANANTPIASFVPAVAGNYAFRLTVNDGAATAAADVPVLVTAPNTVPVANAGLDQSVTVKDKVELNGTGSSDPDSAPSPLAYLWTQLSGPIVSLKRATTAQPNFMPSDPGRHVFSLRVSDGATSAQDEVVVVVLTGEESEIATLIAAVQAAVLSPATKSQLLGYLQGALNALNAINLPPAIAQLELFLQAVESLRANQTLSKSAARDLTQPAEKILRTLAHFTRSKGP